MRSSLPLALLLLHSSVSLTIDPCANPCGYYGQLCCGAAQICYVDSNNEAQCVDSFCTGTGTSSSCIASIAPSCQEYQTFTETLIQTEIKTFFKISSICIITAPIRPTSASTCPPPPTTSPNCQYSQGETPCGSSCCPFGQYCSSPGVCQPVNSPGGSGTFSTVVTVTYTTYTLTASTTDSATTTTSDSLITITTTYVVVPTTTVPFQTPIGTDSWVTLTTTETATITATGAPLACPSKYYLCPGHGGCCRIGLDCQEASCVHPETGEEFAMVVQ